MKSKSKVNRSMIQALEQIQANIKATEEATIEIAKETYAETIRLLVEQTEVTKMSPFFKVGDEHGLSDKIELTITRSEGKVKAVIGVPHGKPTTIAYVQEYGAAIPVTEKMRGFFAYTWGVHLKRTTTHIHVPGKGFWSKAMIQGASRMRKVSKRMLFRRK